MSRIFGTDISNIATNGVPLPTQGGLGGLQQQLQPHERMNGCQSATNKLISTRKLHQGTLSMISTTAGGITNQSQVLTPNIINTTPGMSIVDQSSNIGGITTGGSAAVEGSSQQNKNPRS
jgi:hypothetical protein